MAATYAALLALARSLRDIGDLEQHVDPRHKEKIVSILEKVDFIVTFLEDYPDKYQETLGFRKAAFEAQDFMDSYFCSVSTTYGDWSSSSEASWDNLNLDRDLTMAFERIGFVWEELTKMKNSEAAQELRSVSYSSPFEHSSSVQATAKKMVVGFDEDLMAIKERLYEDASELQIIPIVGMGGIGKTTLARKAYEDSILSRYFDKCAWITVSQEYQRREILSGLFKSLKNEQYSDMSEAELAKRVYQNLIGRRYLIVVDDIWSAEAWDDLKMIFPDDDNGSRILLTTRILDVAAQLEYSDNPWVHRMKCLNEDQSWKLLQESVFGEQSCPLQLVEVGKKIAKNCCVPYEIFKMPKLRHMIIDDPFGLSHPSGKRWINVPAESDLQTMETVMDLIFSEELIRRLVNLKKLRVVYENRENRNWDDFNVDKLSHLRNLEDLEITMSYFPLPSKTWSHAFPMGLKKLSLKSVPFAWENMTIIGSLPNLQVLEMTDLAVAKDS